MKITVEFANLDAFKQYMGIESPSLLAQAPKETADAPAPAPAEEEQEEELADDGELVAVIAAAIAAYEGSTSTDGFVVRSIKRSKTNKWKRA